MPQMVKVAEFEELQPGERKVVELNGGIFVAVFRVGDQYFAIEDVCTHDDGPLGDGEIDGFEVECPRHGGRFDMRTGDAVGFPAVKAVERYEVTIEGGEVFIAVD